MASEDPLPAIFLVVPWGRRAAASQAPIKQPGSYPACVRVQAAAELGFQEARLGPPRPAPFPPDAACRSGRGRLPVSVTLSSARENSMLAPCRRSPTPSRPTPTRILARGPGKAANFKSVQRLWSCPELSTINHGASDFCFASEGGVGRPGSFCLLILHRASC